MAELTVYSFSLRRTNGGRELPTFIDDERAIAHNKAMVVDSHIVITGSLNFTKAAGESNAENLLTIDDEEIAQ